ncbi:PITH domain-containing protein [Lineolata rhizophorae]|uniref:PITH domain-containing protein n=1 Tax=Lineolata rhizophorae TaxID=578093 RepID=A0A6A6P6D8_9PEZI|nr:PITH domain-containing protein [Lineolata rhizophorae]
MSHCHAGHDHAGHNHGDGHDHSDDLTPALQTLLYEQIDFGAVTTLNEATPRSGAAVVQKTWAQRLEPQPELESDADEQLLMMVPFTGQVRLHSILLRTSPTASAPRTLKVFLNRDDLDFGTATELAPTQAVELAQTADVQEHPVKRARFNATRCLALFFEDNFGRGDEDVTRLSYLAFKGDFMSLSKEPVNFLYEAAANPGDHQAIAGTKQGMGSQLGGPGGRDGM